MQKKKRKEKRKKGIRKRKIYIKRFQPSSQANKFSDSLWL